jgi:hypothetical protein
MSKQQNLKEYRNYTLNPRRIGEIDLDHRGDVDHFSESKTVQADASAADINNIMKRYTMEQLEASRATAPALQGNFDTMETYHEAMNIVAEAQSAFHAFPAQVRAHYQNDPAQFLAHVEKAQKGSREAISELIDLGLATKQDLPAPPPASPKASSGKGDAQSAQQPPPKPAND